MCRKWLVSVQDGVVSVSSLSIKFDNITHVPLFHGFIDMITVEQ
jgi:hypothetical protein